MPRFSRLAFWQQSQTQGPPPAMIAEDPATAALRRYLAWCDRRLEAVAVAERLHLRMIGAVEGPQTITLKLRLQRTPTRADLARLLKLGPTFAQALQTSAARMTDNAGGIEVQIPHPRPWTPSAAELAPHTHGLERVAIGLDAYRQISYLDLGRWPHLLTVGPTRRGKSEAIRAILYGLAHRLPAHRLSYIILAKKAGAWSAFAPASGCYGVLTDPEEQADALAWLSAHLDARAATGQRHPAILVIADDLHNLNTTGDLAEPLGYLASLGGEFAIHVILSTQTTGSAGGLTQALEQNLTARLVYGAGDSGAAARFAGRGGTGAELVGKSPGDALLILDGEPQRVATARADDRLIAMLEPGDCPRPWSAQHRQHHRDPLPPETLRAGTRGDNMGGLELVYTGVNGVNTTDNTGHNTTAETPTPPPLLTPDHFPTGEEAALIRHYRQRHSLNQTAADLYGSKNSKTSGLIKWALGVELTATERAALSVIEDADLGDLGAPEPPTASPGPQDGPDETEGEKAGDREPRNGHRAHQAPDLPPEIDLSTPEGRAMLKDLQRAGALRWGNSTDQTEADL